MTPLTEEMIVYSLVASRFDSCKLKANEAIKKFYKNYNPEHINERAKVCHLIAVIDDNCRLLEAIFNDQKNYC